MQKNEWRLDHWYNSGIHTGWRIVRGYGWNMDIDSSYAYNMYKRGDEEAKLEQAKKRLSEITS